jgi:hypothetical protein
VSRKRASVLSIARSCAAITCRARLGEVTADHTDTCRVNVLAPILAQGVGGNRRRARFDSRRAPSWLANA